MILITGASSGLGASLAVQYAQTGEPLVITGRNKARLARVNKLLAQPAQIIAADLSIEQEVQETIAQLKAVPKMIIHCAGSGYFGPIEQQCGYKIAELFNSNVLSTTYLLQQLVTRYKNEAIRVVVIMSTAALIAKAGESTYCAAKWAIKGLVESVRLELKDNLMEIVCIYPGGMATPFWQAAGKHIDTSLFMHPDEAAAMIKQALAQTEHGYVSDITVNRRNPPPITPSIDMG